MRRTTGSILFTLILASAAMAQTVATRLTSSGSTVNYTTIQLAINAAVTGDVIIIEGNTYLEQLKITNKKGITITSKSDAEVILTNIETGNDTCISVRGSSDITLMNISFHFNNAIGVYINSTSNRNRILNCYFASSGTGIKTRGANTIIEGCNLFGSMCGINNENSLTVYNSTLATTSNITTGNYRVVFNSCNLGFFEVGDFHILKGNSKILLFNNVFRTTIGEETGNPEPVTKPLLINESTANTFYTGNNSTNQDNMYPLKTQGKVDNLY